LNRLKKSFFFLFLFALLAGVGVQAELPPGGPKPLAGKVILIDPGHATVNEWGVLINPGARARHGVWERDVALKVSAKVVPLLEAQGAKVYMTRTPANPWRYCGQRKQADNRARAIFANALRAQAYVRIHCDWNRSRKFKGYTTYYYRWGSRELAKSFRKAFLRDISDHHDNGLHRKSFVSVTARMPSVLMELGVLSYKPEAKDLADDAFQNRLAQAVADGLTDYFTQSNK
jgi:N-acetylmuramoyl-L-alanine amidase